MVGDQCQAVSEELVRRVRVEFAEMPGLSLTSVQATKLFAISPDECAGLLARLVEEGLLRVSRGGSYTVRVAPA